MEWKLWQNEVVERANSECRYKMDREATLNDFNWEQLEVYFEQGMSALEALDEMNHSRRLGILHEQEVSNTAFASFDGNVEVRYLKTHTEHEAGMISIDIKFIDESMHKYNGQFELVNDRGNVYFSRPSLSYPGVSLFVSPHIVRIPERFMREVRNVVTFPRNRKQIASTPFFQEVLRGVVAELDYRIHLAKKSLDTTIEIRRRRPRRPARPRMR